MKNNEIEVEYELAVIIASYAYLVEKYSSKTYKSFHKLMSNVRSTTKNSWQILSKLDVLKRVYVRW